VCLPLYPPWSPRECRESGDKMLPGAVVAEGDAVLDPPDPPGVQPPGASGHGSRGRSAAASQAVTYVATGPSFLRQQRITRILRRQRPPLLDPPHHHVVQGVRRIEPRRAGRGAAEAPARRQKMERPVLHHTHQRA
jgi:hypothetical protein